MSNAISNRSCLHPYNSHVFLSVRADAHARAPPKVNLANGTDGEEMMKYELVREWPKGEGGLPAPFRAEYS